MSDVQLLPLEPLMEAAQSASKEAFAAAYPGVFLLALGFVSSEILGGGGRGGRTSAVIFAPSLRHEPGESHPLAGHAFFLPAGLVVECTIGRSADCELTVPDASVSEHHCRLALTDEGITARDLESLNGTSLNLARLEPGDPVLVGDEDILTVGRYSFQVLTSATLHTALALLQELQSS